MFKWIWRGKKPNWAPSLEPHIHQWVRTILDRWWIFDCSCGERRIGPPRISPDDAVVLEMTKGGSLENCLNVRLGLFAWGADFQNNNGAGLPNRFHLPAKTGSNKPPAPSFKEGTVSQDCRSSPMDLLSPQ